MPNATVRVFGPFSWVRPFGGNAFMPGEAHVWALGDLPGAVYAVSAHPTNDAPVQALAVESLSTAYAQTGPAAVNFVVRNVSDTGVFSYRWFVAVIDFA
jgi:hypothetical protein